MKCSQSGIVKNLDFNRTLIDKKIYMYLIVDTASDRIKHFDLLYLTFHVHVTPTYLIIFTSFKNDIKNFDTILDYPTNNLNSGIRF